MNAQEFADSLTAEQAVRLYNIAYPELTPTEDIEEMSDDELLAALNA